MTYAEFRAKQKRAYDRFRKDCLKDEIRLLAGALKRTGGNVAAAARDLGVSTVYVWRRINELLLSEYLASVRERVNR